MRILVDEDVPVQCIAPLQHLLPKHIVEHVQHIGWNGKKDRALFRDAKGRGVDVLLTNDIAQLKDPTHVRLLKRSGLHHVRYAQPTERLVGLGLAMGAIIGAMPLAIEALTVVTGQHLVKITGLSRGNRIEVTNPKTDPPRTGRGSRR